MSTMMAGFNQSVPYGGLMFHVQTEHRQRAGIDEIVSHVFFGGTVVSSQRVSCAPEAGNAALQATPTAERLAVKKQHEDIVRALRDGRFDKRIIATPGTGSFQAVKSVPSPTASESTPSASAEFRHAMALLDAARRHLDSAAKLAPENQSYQRAAKMLSRALIVLGGSQQNTTARNTASSHQVLSTSRASARITSKAAALSTNAQRQNAGETASTPSPKNQSNAPQRPPLSQISTESRTSTKVDALRKHITGPVSIQPDPPTAPLQQATSDKTDATETNASPTASSQERAEQLYEEGVSAVRAGKILLALANWEAAAGLDPSNSKYKTSFEKLLRLRSEGLC